jgi:hypothetical protein
VDVEVERRAIVDDATRPHGAFFGEGITGRLPLKAEAVKSISCRRQGTFTVQEHEVNNALSSAARDGGAADLFHDQTGRLRLDQLGDLSGNLKRPRIVISADCWLVLVRADHCLDRAYGGVVVAGAILPLADDHLDGRAKAYNEGRGGW